MNWFTFPVIGIFSRGKFYITKNYGTDIKMSKHSFTNIDWIGFRKTSLNNSLNQNYQLTINVK